MKNIFTILISILSISAFSQNWDEMIKAVSSDRAAEDYFGYHVIIDENRAVVSSYLEDEDISGGVSLLSAGSVYVFELSNGIWTESAKLVASDRGADDRFGCRVGLSGDRIIVGAFLEDEDASGTATLSDAGSAYIFELIGGVWTETAKIIASDRAAGNRFGYDVAISGNKAIVGAYYNATDTSGGDIRVSAGAAYVFELNGGTWTETIKLVASDRSTYNYFGYSVDMDETRFIVGAQGNLGNTGSAYVFELIGGVWTETTKLIASDGGTNDNFGYSIAISNNRVLVGAYKDGEDALGGNTLIEAGSAYIFELIGGAWTETTKLVASNRGANDQFGICVDISGDNIIIGARYESSDAQGGNILTESGSAYIFEYVGSIWTETTKLVASDRGDNDNFGTSVCISGNKAIVGSLFEDENATGGNTINDAGSVYFYITCPSSVPSVTVSSNILSASTTGATYQWIDCNNGNTVITGETNQSFTATANGDYSVVVTEATCSDTSSCVTVAGVGINDLYSIKDMFSLYPNPANAILSIGSELAIESIIVKDITGKTIKIIANKNNTIDVSELIKGIYFLQVQINNVTLSRKFIKE